jgi:hypothetical protein
VFDMRYPLSLRTLVIYVLNGVMICMAGRQFYFTSPSSVPRSFEGAGQLTEPSKLNIYSEMKRHKCIDTRQIYQPM